MRNPIFFLRMPQIRNYLLSYGRIGVFICSSRALQTSDQNSEEIICQGHPDHYFVQVWGLHVVCSLLQKSIIALGNRIYSKFVSSKLWTFGDSRQFWGSLTGVWRSLCSGFRGPFRGQQESLWALKASPTHRSLGVWGLNWLSGRAGSLLWIKCCCW